jgi:hypothetical protein
MKTPLKALFPLLLQTTSIMSSPVSEHASRCKAHPIFHLHNITYTDNTIYSTPAHLAVSDGSISFSITNTAVSYTTQCSAHAEQCPDFFYGNLVYACTVENGQGVGAGTNFTFEKAGGRIQVNSTWSCGVGYER